jgi:hypothetical protein
MQRYELLNWTVECISPNSIFSLLRQDCFFPVAPEALEVHHTLIWFTFPSTILSSILFAWHGTIITSQLYRFPLTSIRAVVRWSQMLWAATVSYLNSLSYFPELHYTCRATIHLALHVILIIWLCENKISAILIVFVRNVTFLNIWWDCWSHLCTNLTTKVKA